MGMRATVKQYFIIVHAKEKVKGRTKLEQEQIWNGFQGFPKKAAFRKPFLPLNLFFTVPSGLSKII